MRLMFMSDWVTLDRMDSVKLYTPTTARLGVFVTYHLSPTTWTAFYGCQWLVVFYKWELLLDLPWPLKIEQHKQSLLGSAQLYRHGTTWCLEQRLYCQLWLTRNANTISLTLCYLFLYVWRDEWRCTHSSLCQFCWFW